LELVAKQGIVPFAALIWQNGRSFHPIGPMLLDSWGEWVCLLNHSIASYVIEVAVGI